MKRLTISILSFLLLGVFVYAQDEVTLEDLDARVTALETTALYLSGSATVMWGLSGQLIDNSKDWLGEIPDNELFAETDDNPLWPIGWDLTAEITDDDGNVVVSAAAEIDIEEKYGAGADFPPEDGEEDVSYTSIEFPNLVPGMVGLLLEDSDTLSLDELDVVESDTESPRATVTLTPIEGLTAKVGMVYDSMQTMAHYFTGLSFDPTKVTALLINGSGMTPPDVSWQSYLDMLADDAGDPTEWNTGNYANVAVSLEVAYELAMGDMDSITATLGLIYDSAYYNHLFMDSEDYGKDITSNYYVTDQNGAKKVKDLGNLGSFEKDKDAQNFIKDVKNGYVWGYAGVPIGLDVAIDMMGIEATVDFMTRLVTGNDVMNPDAGKGFDFTKPGDEIKDLAKYEQGAPRKYAMPIFAGLDASYEMDMGGMTLSPTANFKFSSDFYKFGIDDPDSLDDTTIVYQGDVSGAEFVARQMSAGGGVDVEGIADMIDVSLSGSVGFGFGSGEWDWPFDDYYNAVMWPTDLTKRVSNLNKDAKDADKAAKDAKINIPNNMLFIDDMDAYMVEVGVTATPLDALTIENTFSYIHDGLGLYYVNDEENLEAYIDTPNVLGFSGAYNTDPDTGVGLVWTDQIENETNVEYEIMVGMNVGCTLYGDFTFTKQNYIGEMGTYPDGWDKDTELFNIFDSQVASKNTFDYEIGVKVTVDTYSVAD